MDLKQLQALLAVVEHGGFTAAARATHTVQSNISTHIARLEQELGTTLIDRSRGKPTEEGEAVVLRARRIQNELVSMQSDVSSLQNSPRGNVKFGMIGTTARWLTSLLVEELSQQAPEVRLLITDGSTRSIERGLLNGELDLGLLGIPLEEPDLKTTPLFDEDQVVIAPNDHPLTKIDSCSLEELSQHHLLLAAPGTSFRQEVDESFSKRGLRAIPKLEVDGVRLLASLAFQNFGVAIIPATAVPESGNTWRRIPVQGLSRRTVGLAAQKRGIPTVAAKVTAAALKKVIQEKAQEVEGIELAEGATSGK